MFPKPNRHGVYPEAQAECIDYKAGKAYAIIRLLQVADNAWVQSSSVQYQDGGMSEPLSKWRTYTTRREALSEALKRVERYSKNYAPRVSLWAAQQSVHLTNGTRPVQLALFPLEVLSTSQSLSAPTIRR